MGHHIVKRIVWFCVLFVLAYTAWVVVTNFRDNIATLRAFPWIQLPLIIAAVTANYLLRELKWDYYRRAAGINVPRLGSFLVFFSGFSMAVSPGRVGELIKPFMYKEYFGYKMRRTLSLVFCERISDVLGMIAVAAVALPMYVHGIRNAGKGETAHAPLIYGFLIFSAISVGTMLWVIRKKRLVYGLMHYMTSHPKLQRTGFKLRRLYFATYPLMTARNLIITTAIAAASWLFECVALMMILRGAGGASIGLGEASFVFCMATIFGGFLFFAPGGLGGFEGSAQIMLLPLGMALHQIVPAILITRFCTLFYAVGLGFIFIVLTSIKYHKPMEWDEFEHMDAEKKPAA